MLAPSLRERAEVALALAAEVLAGFLAVSFRSRRLGTCDPYARERHDTAAHADPESAGGRPSSRA